MHIGNRHALFARVPVRVDVRVDPALVDGGAAFFLRVSFFPCFPPDTRFEARSDTRDDFLVGSIGDLSPSVPSPLSESCFGGELTFEGSFTRKTPHETLP